MKKRNKIFNLHSPAGESIFSEELNFQKGFSLLELLIYIAVLGGVMMMISAIFLSVAGGRGSAEARTEVSDNINFVMEKIERDLRLATSSASVIAPVSAGESGGVLTFTIAGENTVSYELTGDNKIKRSHNGAGDIITTDTVRIDALSFTRIENVNAYLGETFVSVRVSLTASYRSDRPDWQYALSKQMTVAVY